MLIKSVSTIAIIKVWKIQKFKEKRLWFCQFEKSKVKIKKSTINAKREYNQNTCINKLSKKEVIMIMIKLHFECHNFNSSIDILKVLN